MQKLEYPLSSLDLAGDHRAAFSIVPVGNQIGYARLTMARRGLSFVQIAHFWGNPCACGPSLI
jgi:hypothetical protein